MDNKPFTVYGERIKEAREIRGFSQTTLSELIGVQRQSVSAYEKNRIKPSAETLFKIAAVTKFPNSFFLNDRPRGDGERTAPMSFRKREASTKTARLQAEQYENLFADIYYYLKHYIDFFKPNIPFSGMRDYRTIKDAEIEDIATGVRRAWGLGDGPIQHITRLLENNGLLIAPVKLSMTMDAFSTWRHERPVIMLSDANKSCCGRRFNEAHELGHLILHSTIEDEDFNKSESRVELERQANYFAGAFLFPLSSVNNEFFSCSIPALIELKKRWRISIGAIATRLYNLHVINKNQYKYIMIQLGSNRKKEPLDDDIPMEIPTTIKRAFDALVEKKILSVYQAVEDIQIPPSIFSMLTNVELPDRENIILPFSLR